MFNLTKDQLEKYKLSADQVRQRLEKLQTLKSEEARDKAKQEIVMANIGLIGHVIKPYTKFQNISADDFIQEGVLGLYAAIDKYRLDSPAKFSTVAYMWIRQKVQRFLEKNAMNDVDKNKRSLDKEVFDDSDGPVLADRLEAEDNTDTTVTEANALLKDLMDAADLTDREKKVVMLRYGIR